MTSADVITKLLNDVDALKRRMESIIIIGTVFDTDYEKAKVKIKHGDLVTKWLPWLTQRAGQDVTWWAPEKGEQVLVVSIDGDPANGYVLPGAIYSKHVPAVANKATVRKVQFADGAVVEYDREEHHLKVILPSGSTTELVSDGGIKLVGDIEHIGEFNNTAGINSQADITDKTRSMAADRGIYNDHKHPGVTPGGGQTAVTAESQ